MARTTDAQTPETAPRKGMSMLASAVALSAYGGALGLALGFLTLPPEVAARLPLDSPVLSGLALTLVVAIPTTSLAWLAWHGDRRTDAMAAVAGVLLISWILVELAFIRELSFFHPTYLLVGAALIWSGRHALRDLPPPGTG